MLLWKIEGSLPIFRHEYYTVESMKKYEIYPCFGEDSTDCLFRKLFYWHSF